MPHARCRKGGVVAAGSTAAEPFSMLAEKTGKKGQSMLGSFDPVQFQKILDAIVKINPKLHIPSELRK
jgi:hypothetical protein